VFSAPSVRGGVRLGGARFVRYRRVSAEVRLPRFRRNAGEDKREARSHIERVDVATQAVVNAIGSRKKQEEIMSAARDAASIWDSQRPQATHRRKSVIAVSDGDHISCCAARYCQDRSMKSVKAAPPLKDPATLGRINLQQLAPPNCRNGFNMNQFTSRMGKAGTSTGRALLLRAGRLMASSYGPVATLLLLYPPARGRLCSGAWRGTAHRRAQGRGYPGVPR
jgi:hypothetical protein